MAKLDESRLDRFENTLNMYIAQLGTSAKHETFPALVQHQQYPLPVEPDFFKPWKTAHALFGDSTPINTEPSHQDKVTRIAQVIARFKNELGCDQNASHRKSLFLGAFATRCEPVNLSEVDLSNTSLHRAQLQGADFTRAKLQEASLYKASLQEANLQGANLQDANLDSANLTRVNFKDANLHGVNLIKARGLTCEQLTQARYWEMSYRDKLLACGADIPVQPKKQYLTIDP